MQLIYRPDNGEILGVHIFGMHAADLIHEASNAIAMGTRIQVDVTFHCMFLIKKTVAEIFQLNWVEVLVLDWKDFSVLFSFNSEILNLFLQPLRSSAGFQYHESRGKDNKYQSHF